MMFLEALLANDKDDEVKTEEDLAFEAIFMSPKPVKPITHADLVKLMKQIQVFYFLIACINIFGPIVERLH